MRAGLFGVGVTNPDGMDMFSSAQVIYLQGLRSLPETVQSTFIIIPLKKLFISLKTIVPNGFKVICGLDEVGRGPWAGPLVACALILKKNFVYKGLKDSKQLSEKKREEVFQLLKKKAIYGIGITKVKEIDRLGIGKATNLAFLRALKKLPIKPDYLLIDGRDALQLPHPFTSIIKGDEKIKIIACASIIAKVTRDHMMVKLARKYPEYGFDEHKGYGTKKHQKAMIKNGICELHRKSFKPVFRSYQIFLNLS